MPIDSSIYFQQQTPDLLGSVEKGLSMRETLQKQQMQNQALQREATMRDLMRANTKVGPDGQVIVDRGGLIGGLNQAGMTDKALDYSKSFNIEDAEHRKALGESLELTAQLMNPVKDQQSYSAARALALKNNVLTEKDLPEEYDPNLVSGLAKQAEKHKDTLEQKYRDQTLALKEKELGLKHQEVGMKRDQMNADKTDKLAQNFKKDLDPDASRTGNFGQISAKYQAGQRLKALQDAFPGGNLPAAQMEEYALGLANMVSGSSGAARAQVEALVPHSVVGDAQKLKSWILNNPYGAEQQKFVDMMSHTVDREMELAGQQMKDIQARRLSAHQRFKQVAPDQYKQMLNDYGIDDANVKNGRYVAPAAPGGTVQMKAPDGSIRSIPADQVEAAKKAGGVPL